MKVRSNLLNNKKILVTGGTGSFGTHFIKNILKFQDPAEIVVFSRDEKKQFDMRNQLNSEKIRYIIGNIRDKSAIKAAMNNVDYVFHAAALKQVPTCEFYPMEAIKTNILGSNNIMDTSEDAGVDKVIILGTDKSVYPINAMGMTKALMEKIMTSKARMKRTNTIFCGVRYGNVLFSRGSVLPLFLQQIKNNLPLTVTNSNMTRFLLPLPEAVNLVLQALQSAETGDILVRKSPAATIGTLASAMQEIFNYKKEVKIIGTRIGEKMHETLLTREEMLKTENNDKFYRVKNLEKMDYAKFYTLGEHDQIPEEGYTSENTQRLSIKETRDLLISLKEIQEGLGYS